MHGSEEKFLTLNKNTRNYSKFTSAVISFDDQPIHTDHGNLCCDAIYNETKKIPPLYCKRGSEKLMQIIN